MKSLRKGDVLLKPEDKWRGPSIIFNIIIVAGHTPPNRVKGIILRSINHSANGVKLARFSTCNAYLPFYTELIGNIGEESVDMYYRLVKGDEDAVALGSDLLFHTVKTLVDEYRK